MPTRWASDVAAHTLDNGLLTLVQQRRDSSFTGVCLTVGVGQSDDPPDYEGLAHLTEHLMFTPTTELPDGFGAFVEATGASYVNAVTSLDATSYCTEVPNEGLERVLYAEAMRMGFLLANVTEDDVERERAAVLHEQRERGSEQVGWRMGEAVDEALWGQSHPYGRARESEDSVERLRLEHVQWFVQRWYGPQNMTLAVVGPEEPTRVQEWIRRYFGPLRGQAPPERQEIALPEREPTRITVFAPTYSDRLMFAWTTPRAHDLDDAALSVLGQIFEDRLGERYEDADDISQVAVEVVSRARGSTFTCSSEARRRTTSRRGSARSRPSSRGSWKRGPPKRTTKTTRRWHRSFGSPRRSVLTVASPTREPSGARSRRRAGRPPLREARPRGRGSRAGRRWLRPERRVVAQRRMHRFASFEGDVRRRSLR
ncbi:MAG: pitrilysin family protein [Polyangiales bacterium]